MPKLAGALVLPGFMLMAQLVLLPLWLLDKAVKDAAARRLLRRIACGVPLTVASLATFSQAFILAFNLGVNLPVAWLMLSVAAATIVLVVVLAWPLIRAETRASKEAVKRLPPGTWFPAKRFGWGWGLPCAWQGWLVMIVCLVLTIAGCLLIACRFHGTAAALLILPYLIAMIAAISIICWVKGERPQWRWGEDS
jgi:hypothetical protein